jgi:hypothetical protein
VYYETGDVEIDCADSGVDFDGDRDDVRSDVVYVKKEGWARCSAFFSIKELISMFLT